MTALIRLTKYELRLFLREPTAAFFTLAFPLIILFVFGSIFGNTPDPHLGGHGSVDVSTPGYMAMIIGTTGLLGLPQVLATYRDGGILRRLRATPLHPYQILGAQVAVHLAMTAAGTALLVVAARLVFGLATPEASPLALIGAFTLGCLSFYAIGFVLASLLPTARAAQAVGSAIFFPMLFLSGASVPRETMSATMRHLTEFLPLTQVVILLSDLWFGKGWNLVALVTLSGLLAGGALVSVLTFRWE